VCSRNLENEEAKTLYRAVKIQPQLVVTPGKQTTNNFLVFKNHLLFNYPYEATLKVLSVLSFVTFMLPA
jgi:hypothetical protein